MNRDARKKAVLWLGRCCGLKITLLLSVVFILFFVGVAGPAAGRLTADASFGPAVLESRSAAVLSVAMSKPLAVLATKAACLVGTF